MSKNKAQNDNTVTLHYRGTFDDGTEFDTSYDREPLEAKIGAGQLIPGFENALVGMAEGEKKTVCVSPEEGYGPSLAEAIQVVPKSQFPGTFDFKIGAMVSGQNEDGHPLVARIVEEDVQTVTLDFNHPMAGKNLNFDIELLTVQ